MRYRISEVKIGPEEYSDRERRMEHLERALRRRLRKSVGKSASALDLEDLEIIRESIDARRKPDVKAVYTLDFDCPQKLPLPAGGIREYEEEFRWVYESGGSARTAAEKEASVAAETETRAEEEAMSESSGGSIYGRMEEERPPVIAGFGPCGIFAALILAEAGLNPIVLERGQPVEQRMEDVRRFWEEGILDPESNVQFGEGGAGTFSDGKLTTGIRDIRIRKVLREFVSAGADPEILYQQKPHIGTDRLREIIPNLRNKIRQMGGEIRFGRKLTGLETSGGRLTAVIVSDNGQTPAERQFDTGQTSMECGAEECRADTTVKTLRIPADDLILAIGHSARDTFRMLQKQPVSLPMEPKAFSIGVRIEHPQERIDAAQYGDPALAKVFGPAAYKLHYRCGNGRGVYTFCMCPGGRVINASSEEGGAVTNGMSESQRDSGTANAGLLVDVRPSDFDSEDPLAGMEFQRKYERLAWEQARLQSSGLPQTVYGQFREDPEDPVRQCLPAFAGEAILEAMPHLGRKLQGFDAADAVMTAVETRSSSPVRILRNEEMQSGILGVIPAGEGPGYAGGIMSAAVDGIKAAEQVIRRHTKRGFSFKEQNE